MNIILGVAGGIATYKSPEIVRRLKDAGHEVRVVMTAGAQAFVTPLTFQAVSGEPVHRDLLDETAEAAMGHIELARWADMVLAAPGHREPDGSARARFRRRPARHPVPRHPGSDRSRPGP